MNDKVTGYEVLAEDLAGRGVDLDAVKAALKTQHVETPSWGYGNSGTRFKVFAWPGAARTAWEKFADAAQVHKYTGIAPTVAIHIPWDKVDDYTELKEYAASLGVGIGAVNPNLFQNDDYKLGSMCHPDPAVRRKAVDHMLECLDICQQAGSTILSLWFADGTNYAGQDSFRARKRRMEEALREVYAHLPDGVRMLIEYKFFEPAFYHTDLADWGMAYTMATKLGEKAQVLVDTGHHAQGTNIQHIVAFLLDEGKLGGFHLNNRKYADDDLMVGSVNPFEVFLIYNELVGAVKADDPEVAICARNVAYMIDQSHNIEPKIEVMIQSVINCQIAYAKALLVDRRKLAECQAAGDVLGAHRVLMEAYETDVRPLLAQVRIEMGLHPDPIAAFKASGYAQKVAEERGTAGGGGGYPSA
ncbi:MAG TPA: L-rhamnose isomerase [Anaerolineae bacterium]|nr:L-rhamnose isomerase [Anaerolineae bacterium]HIQ06596.1 L-rhamnose isomerase [Anaerolineae bacterium]